MKNAAKTANVRRGFSLLEAVVALLLTGILMTGVVYTLGSLVDTAGQTTNPQQSTSDWQRTAAEFTADMTAATSCDTQGLSTAIESLAHHEISVYADDNGDAIPDRIRWHTDNTTLFRDVHYATAECDMPASPDSSVAVATNLDPTATAAGILTASRSNETLTYPTLTSCGTRPTPCTLDYITLALSLPVNDIHRTYTVGSPVGVNRAATRFEGLAAVAEPGTPVAPTVSDGTGAGTAYISWTPPMASDGVAVAHGSHPIDRWHISYSTDPAFSTETVEQTALYSPWTYTISGLTGGAPIYVRIAAESAAGISDYSPTASNIPVGFPGAPTGVQANLNPVDFTEATFSFTAPTDLGGGTLSHFELQTSVDGGPWSPTPPTSIGTATTGTAAVASPAFSSIAVRVRTINEEGPSPWATGTAVMFPTPTAPQNLTGSVAGTTVNFAFDPPADDGGTPITGYLLAYSIDGAPMTSPTSLGLNTTGTITLPNTPATDVDVNVYAQTRAGDSPVATMTVTPVAPPTALQLLLVAGGGGGGEAAWWGAGGGGGAGGLVEVSSVSVASGATYSVSVGEGGEGGTNSGSNGENSVFASYTAIGGGFGARGGESPWAPETGGTGGSGGGSSSYGGFAAGTPGQGSSGGTGDGAWNYTGGGGGGAAGAGGNAPNATSGGSGGLGKSNSITGSPVTYARGGHGGSTYGTASDGAANSGNGGGGGPATPGGWLEGGDGGSGIVVLRFEGASPTVSAGLTYIETAVGNDTVLTFTSGSGTITW